jgi:hypothetical protein
MIEGIREPAIAADLIDPDGFDRGLRDLEATSEPDGVFCYTFFRATATKTHRRLGLTSLDHTRDDQ